MKAAEELGLTLETIGQSLAQKRYQKQPVLILSQYDKSGYAPMELGISHGKFTGKYHNCGKQGYKAPECWSGSKTPCSN